MTTNKKPTHDQIKTNLFKLISAHRNFQAAVKEFENITGMETVYQDEPLQLYGESAYQFLAKHGGVESINVASETMEVNLKIDGAWVVCVKI